MTPIDEYLAKLEPVKRSALERIRELAKKAVPDADETISYGMPTLNIEESRFLASTRTRTTSACIRTAAT
jgi:uncharacterized protein YdhG (YjbR/CyaY superfamily)